MNCINEIRYNDCMPWSRISNTKLVVLSINFMMYFYELFKTFYFGYRYNSTIFSENLKASKTVWPVPQINQVFLPDFKIKSLINEHSFEVMKNLI